MNNEPREFLEQHYKNCLTGIDPAQAVNVALDQLYSDQEHKLTDQVVPGLTYEDLLVTLQAVQKAYCDPDAVTQYQGDNEHVSFGGQMSIYGTGEPDFNADRQGDNL